jgi:methylamine---corrinoid protein Co-methyltransferase
MSRPDILDILERTQTGEYCPVKEWDVRRIPTAVRQKLKAYRLEKTFTPADPVNCDDALADAFFRAGYELALDLGMLCETTERIVRVSKEELDDALAAAPSALFVGEGADGRWIRHRLPEDPQPMTFGASMAITTTEETWALLTQGIAAEREVDILSGPSIIQVNGRPFASGTPFETWVGYRHATMRHELCRRAGRPGMGAVCNPSSITEFGVLASYGVPGGYRTTDICLALFPSELKITHSVLHKVVHILNLGGHILAGSPAMIGGMPGPPEGAVLSQIACALAQVAVLHSQVGGGEIYDIRELTNVNRAGLWALSVTHQALSRNTHLLSHGIANEVSGPCTETFLLEGLVGVATLAASGTAYAAGPRPAGGKLTDYLTPLECRWCAEVAHAASGMSRRRVNEIAKEILPRYEGRIRNPDVGKPFQEAYDLSTMQPSDEWSGIYRRVKAEAIALGLPLRD